MLVDAGVIYFSIIDLFCYFSFVLLTNLSYGFTFVVCKFFAFCAIVNVSVSLIAWSAICKLTSFRLRVS